MVIITVNVKHNIINILLFNWVIESIFFSFPFFYFAI